MMIEEIVVKYLNQNGIKSYAEEPEDSPDSFAIIGKTGGGGTKHIKSATIFIQTYAQSKLGACQLNEEVKRLMFDILSLDEIIGISLNDDYDYTDTRTKRYRYQAVYDITHY